MFKIKEAIVVEGRYDKNTLRQIVDCTVIETCGFGIFSDKEKVNFTMTLSADVELASDEIKQLF